MQDHRIDDKMFTPKKVHHTQENSPVQKKSNKKDFDYEENEPKPVALDVFAAEKLREHQKVVKNRPQQS
jgi:hypothetical protein